MANILNRREWLKLSSILAANAALARNAFSGELKDDLLDIPQKSPLNDLYAGKKIALNNNENPYGISPFASEAAKKAISISNRYADDDAPILIKMIADKEGVDPDMVVLAAGATEIYSIFAILYGSYGKEVVLANPTFFGFEGYVNQMEGKSVRVTLDNMYKHNLNAMKRKVSNSTNMVYICNPNNPTGTIVDGNDLESFCDEVGRTTPILVDEAYHELVDDSRHKSMLPLVKKGRNILVARTFSKVYGLAGARVGYGITTRKYANIIRNIQTNFAPVSAVSLHMAMASLKDSNFYNECNRNNDKVKEYMYSELGKLNKKFIRSETNFMIFKVDIPGRTYVNKLISSHNVHTRPMSFMNDEWCRISMGTMEEMKVAVEAIKSAG